MKKEIWNKQQRLNIKIFGAKYSQDDNLAAFVVFNKQYKMFSIELYARYNNKPQQIHYQAYKTKNELFNVWKTFSFK